MLASAWLVLMVVTALGADYLLPYSFTALDLKARLAPPILMGGTTAHLLGTDELGRDVLSRLIMSIRMSLLIALFGTIIAATLGTALGVLAAHFRKWVEQVVLMAIDFQASVPFMIIALAVLAFLGNSLPLFIALMGFHSLGALRPHLPWPDLGRQRAGLCRRDPPARRQPGAHLRGCTSCPTSPRP